MRRSKCDILFNIKSSFRAEPKTKESVSSSPVPPCAVTGPDTSAGSGAARDAVLTQPEQSLPCRRAAEQAWALRGGTGAAAQSWP